MNDQEPVTPNQFFEGLATAVLTVARTFEQVALSFCENVAIPLHNALQEAYHEAGSPFGDTQEGLLMWMEVISLANRREQEAEYRRMRHELVIDAVRLGKEIRKGATS